MSTPAERVRAYLQARTQEPPAPMNAFFEEGFIARHGEHYLREADLKALLQAVDTLAALLAQRFPQAPDPGKTYLTDPRACPHTWVPLSFRFETQLLDPEGRVRIRQPDLDEGKVYCVCMQCAQWTYITTSFCGSQQYGSAHRRELREQEEESTPE